MLIKVFLKQKKNGKAILFQSLFIFSYTPNFRKLLIKRRIYFLYNIYSHVFEVGLLPVYVTFSVCPTICRAPYLKNHTPCDHNFWYTYVKWWKGKRYTWVKGQKMAQNEKYNLHPSHTMSQEQYIIWSCFLVHFKMTSPRVVLFYQNVDFSGC